MYTGCNLKTTKLLDCALIRVCMVIRMIAVSALVCRDERIEEVVWCGNQLICFISCLGILIFLLNLTYIMLEESALKLVDFVIEISTRLNQLF